MNKFFENSSINEILLLFMDQEYYKEVLKLSSKDIRIVRQDSEIRKYSFIKKGYFVEINLKNKIIKHNCAYWNFKCAKRYKLCKHIAKVFLIMYERDSKKILKDIVLNDWIFETFQSS
ncbi:MAG: hypothetical protein ACTSPQ_15220 [Candidatus Helarchaeota archaeon]